MPPTRPQHSELPLTTISLGPWLVTRVRSALTALSRGRMSSASRLAEAMLTDDRLGGVLDVRVSTLIGLPVQLTAADDSAAAEEAVKRLEAGSRELLHRIFPRNLLKEVLSQGLLLGVIPVETIWEVMEGSWVPKLHTWSPEWLDWWDQRVTSTMPESLWQLQTADGLIYFDPDNIDPDAWTFFAPLAESHPFRRGLVLRLAVLWLLRSWMLRDWGRWGERHGLATILGRTPGDAPEAQRQAFMRALVDLASDPVVEAPTLIDPQTGKEERFDVDLLEAGSSSWRGFDRLWSRLDTSIAVAIAGQNLTSEVSSGSLAAARVHDRIRRDILEADAAELAAWQQKILRRWAHWNLGSADLAPRLSYDTEPPAEGDLGREVLEAGVVRVDELRSRHGLPALGEEGGGQDFVQLGMDREPGDMVTQQATLAAPRGVNLEAQLFLDGLADNLRGQAAGEVKTLLEKVLEEVSQASGYADLRSRLLALYEDTPAPEQLTDLMRQALILADLAGRAAVTEGG